jgi:probable rRNA maturation factor
MSRQAAQMPLNITVQYATSRRGVPHAVRLRRWALAARASAAAVRKARTRLVALSESLTIRVVNARDSRVLNRQWRGKDYATNVLSFPDGTLSPDEHERGLGDLIICAPVVRSEARSQRKTGESHWAHMVVHGVLHLLGYDHVNDRDARQMERLEVEILGRFGYSDPYHLMVNRSDG